MVPYAESMVLGLQNPSLVIWQVIFGVGLPLIVGMGFWTILFYRRPSERTVERRRERERARTHKRAGF
jgi:hypothetical protein